MYFKPHALDKSTVVRKYNIGDNRFVINSNFVNHPVASLKGQEFRYNNQHMSNGSQNIQELA